MEINIELSNQLKEKYNHKQARCYNNAIRILLNENSAQKLWVGFIFDKDAKHLFRHMAVTIDNKIVDTTIKDMASKTGNLVYYNSFLLSKSEVLNLLAQELSKDLHEYNSDIEKEVFKKLIEENDILHSDVYLDVRDNLRFVEYDMFYANINKLGKATHFFDAEGLSYPNLAYWMSSENF